MKLVAGTGRTCGSCVALKTTDGENETSLRSGKVNRELAAFIPDILPN